MRLHGNTGGPALSLMAVTLWAGIPASNAQDFGDAPEGALAYPSLGVMGSFPTCAQIGPSGAIRHATIGPLWMGPAPDPEPDGNAGLCPMFAPYDADECFMDGDAGLIIPAAYTILGAEVPCPSMAPGPPTLGMACTPAAWGPNIDIEVHNNLPGLVAYLNVLIDWDQSGSWGGASQCPSAAAPEWVLQNFPVFNGFNGPISALGPPPFLIGPKSGYVWMRMTLSDAPITTMMWNGAGSFEIGETEDYLILVGGQEAPEACCPPDGRCYLELPSLCQLAGNAPKGPGTVCLGDSDKDGIDDICEPMFTKFIQPPDVNRTGMDIKATPLNILADDFLCTRRTLITNITIWGSWKNDILPGGYAHNVAFTLSIHDDGLEGTPGPLRWMKTFPPGTFSATNVTPTGTFSESWWDPATGLYMDPGDKNIWRYDFTIPPEEAFCQSGSIEIPRSYWLDLQAMPMDPEADFGWKTTKSPESYYRFPAVWGVGTEPYPGPWSRLYYPAGVWAQQGLGLAFSLGGDQTCEEKRLDFGDAPEGVLAYPSGVVGQFPTCTTAGPAAWIQHMNFGAWFGPMVDFEMDGNGGLCPAYAPYDNDECFNDGDAGLLMPQAYTLNAAGNVVPCPSGTGPNTPLGRVCTPAAWGANIDILIHNWMPNHPPYLAAYVNVLIDWDQNGSWTGASQCPTAGTPEWVLRNFVIPPQYDGPLSALAPPGFLIGPNAGHAWVRFSITEVPILNPTDWDGAGSFEDGETEDYLVKIDPAEERLDFGDAPDPKYPTLRASNGARHVLGSALRLGNQVDAEADGQPTANADGDDLNPPAGVDDEDGVAFISPLIPGMKAIVRVTAPAGGKLDAWVDFGADGSWAEAGDQVFASVALNPGVNDLKFAVPAGAFPTQAVTTFSRFRLSSAGGLSYVGAARDGEVEDNRVEIVPLKWLQKPDLSEDPPTGVDVDNYWVEEADDFRCTQSGGITDIHLWTSYNGDSLCKDPSGLQSPSALTITLKIYADIPAGQDPQMPWSHPGRLLWSRTFAPGSYNAYLYADKLQEWWYDPATQIWFPPPADTMCYQYDFYIPAGEAFVQTKDRIYWLGVKYDATVNDDCTWGWKSSRDHWNDDAVYFDSRSGLWKELRYGDGHPMAPDSMDLAFAITGAHEPQLQVDFGDAPEGVLAYPGGLIGTFPTCINVGPAASWIQHTNFGAWLGPAVDFETDGNAGLCPGFNPYDADECFQDGDAGLLFPPAYTLDQAGKVVPCGSGAMGALGATCMTAVWGKNIDVEVHNHMPNQTVGYLNVLIDWDRNGKWSGASQCPTAAAPEHVLVNFPIANPYDGPVSGLMAAGTSFVIGPNAGEVWMRVTLTERPVGMAVPWDGSGVFEDGETEDYLLQVIEALDYGDAPDPMYPTLKASNGASHGRGAPILGNLKDLEADGLPAVNADGDDLNNQPDEDGVVFLTNPLVPGLNAQVQVTMSGAANALLSAWIDFNGDGSWATPGDQIFVAQLLLAGPNVLNFPVPATAKPNTDTYARFRVHTNPGGVPFFGQLPYGEVEDYKVRIGQEEDWGDAPDSLLAPQYPTLAAHNGARHKIVPGIMLGHAIDAEPDGQPNANADGDDLAPPAMDDEDGVSIVGMIVPGQPATVQVTASVQGYLFAWMDFAGNGNWSDAGDAIFITQLLNAGSNTLAFNVPATAVPGTTYARFRFVTPLLAVPLPDSGPAGDGEVEDYLVRIEEPPQHDLGDAPDSSNSFPPTPMTAYPPGEPAGVPANFPTVYRIGSPPWGPLHRQPLTVAHLGQRVSLENEADTGPDQDPANNIIPLADSPDRDVADDGVIFPLKLPRCCWSRFNYQVKFIVPSQALYVNAWFDWNRDGDWDDILDCQQQGPAPEWAVQNQLIGSVIPGLVTFATPQFLPWHPVTGVAPEAPPIWMRITLSERPWQPTGVPGGGGSGPQGGYEIGETEDYYFVPEIPTATIVNRQLFYAGSSWGTTPVPNIAGAVGNKVAKLPGTGSATFENVSSHSRGVTGIYIDVARPIPTCPPLSVTAADCVFRYGNVTNISLWVGVPPAPAIAVAPGAGVGGSDRISLTWNDNAIPDKNWLHVRLLANANTHLAADDVFYFGNLVGEIGDVFAPPTRFTVTSTDYNGIFNNRSLTPIPNRPITDLYDMDRNKVVNSTDYNNYGYNVRSMSPIDGLVVISP